MNTVAFKKMELAHELNLIPEDRLDEVQKVLERLFFSSQSKKGSKNLKGIWNECGFEILSLEKELKELKKGIEIRVIWD